MIEAPKSTGRSQETDIPEEKYQDENVESKFKVGEKVFYAVGGTWATIVEILSTGKALIETNAKHKEVNLAYLKKADDPSLVAHHGENNAFWVSFFKDFGEPGNPHKP